MPVERVIKPRQEASRESWIISWDNLTSTDVGTSLTLSDANDKSVHITGTLGGGTILIEGSNDNVNWATLTDPQGNPLSFIAGNKIEAVLEATAYIRPSWSGITGSASVVLFVRGQVS